MITSLHDVNQPEEEAPLSYRQAIVQLPRQWLRVITRPEAHTLAKEVHKANWVMVCVQLFVMVVASIIGVVLVELLNALLHIHIGVTTHLVLLESLAAPQFGWLDLGLTPIKALLFTLITVSILHGLARLFGGQGSFRNFLYTSLLFLSPVLVIEAMIQYLSLTGWLSSIGLVLQFGIKIFIVILQIFVLVAVYRLSYRSAVACVLILIGISIPLELLAIPVYMLVDASSIVQSTTIPLELLIYSINLF